MSDAWARPTAGQSTTSAAYMTIANQGEGNDMLTAARTPKAEAIELHQTTMTAEGVMQMRQIKDGLPIEAGKTIELKPGGTHFMLLGLDGGLNAGETLLVTLEFAKAGAVEVTVPVSADAPRGARRRGTRASLAGDRAGIGQEAGPVVYSRAIVPATP